MNDIVLEYAPSVLNVLLVITFLLFLLWVINKKKIIAIGLTISTFIFGATSLLFFSVASSYDKFAYLDKAELKYDKEMELKVKAVIDIASKPENQEFTSFKAFIEMALKDGYLFDEEYTAILKLDNSKEAKKNLEITVQQEEDIEILNKAYEEQQANK